MKGEDRLQLSVLRNYAKNQNRKLKEKPLEKKQRDLLDKREKLLSKQLKRQPELKGFVKRLRLLLLVRKPNVLRENVQKLLRELKIFRRRKRLKRKLPVSVNVQLKLRDKKLSVLQLEKPQGSNMNVKSNWLRNVLKPSSVRRLKKRRLVRKLNRNVNVPLKKL